MELWLLGKNPIDPDHPTGSDVRYEPEFESLQAEIDKLSSPSAAGGIDWKKVVKLSSEILARKSKDLLVTTYLAVAQIHTNQLDGLAIGLRIYHDLLEEFWEDFYPPKKRMRGRLAAIEWWLEKSEAALQLLKPKSLPPEKIEELKEDLRHIDKILREHWTEAPLLRPVERFLDSIPVLSEKKPEPEAPPSEEKPARETLPRPEPEKPPSQAAPPAQEEIASEKDAQRVLRFGLQKVRQAAAYLREHDIADPGIYRWARMVAWSVVNTLPPVTDGQTMIPPPSPQVQATFNELREKGNSEALLQLAERTLSQFIFWLDLNRFSAEALAALGDRYCEAHDVVCQETALLIHRLSGLEELAFSDGTPFADAATKQWLKGIGLGASAVMAESALVAQDEDRMAEAIRKAQALAKKRKLAEAVEMLQQQLRDSFSQRERLQWRLALSQLLLNAKRPRVALPHLEQILQDIALYRLEEWDPELALKGFKIVWTGLGAQSDDASRNKADDTLNRIAKLDPAVALRLAKG